MRATTSHESLKTQAHVRSVTNARMLTLATYTDLVPSTVNGTVCTFAHADIVAKFESDDAG